MRLVLTLLLGSVLAAGTWLLLRPTPPIVIRPNDEAVVPPEAAPATTVLSPAMAGGLATAPVRVRTSKVTRAPGLSVVERGAVVVTVVPPTGGAAPTDVTIDAQPLDFFERAKSLPDAQDDGTWRYDALAVGRWRIRVYAPGFVDASKVVVVAAESESEISIPLEVGGSASWKVALVNGETPEGVKVALLDGRGISIEGTYRTRATTFHAAPTEVPVLPAEGSVVGLKVGKYRLRASTQDGEPKELAFEVKPGETVALEFTLPR